MDDLSQQAAEEALIKVKANRIERLMDMVGELSLVADELINDEEIAHLELDEFHKTAHRLNQLIRELQDETLGLRLVPISNVFNRMQRLIRDLARQTGKQLDYKTQGEETEIDKWVVDTLADPIMHLIRNSVDHGLEMPEERRRLGKAEKGCVTLSAVQEGGEIIIAIQDDGKGLDELAIKNKAISKGLIAADTSLSQKEIFDLIFEPGFSTKETVSNLSGRGVGMDVVKSTVTELRGRIEVQSTAGKGSLFRLMIPLSLAFLDTLVVRVEKILYAFSIENISEVFEAKEADIVRCSATSSASINIRNQLVSLCNLKRFYQKDAALTITPGIYVVIESRGEKNAIPVDEICGQYQVTIKKLQGALKGIRAASGCALLPNGNVAVLMDCHRLTSGATRH